MQAHAGGDEAGVREQAEAVLIVRDDKADWIDGIMLDGEALDGEVADLEFLSGLKSFPFCITYVLLANDVCGFRSCEDGCGLFFEEIFQAAYVVAVFVCE